MTRTYSHPKWQFNPYSTLIYLCTAVLFITASIAKYNMNICQWNKQALNMTLISREVKASVFKPSIWALGSSHLLITPCSRWPWQPLQCMESFWVPSLTQRADGNSLHDSSPCLHTPSGQGCKHCNPPKTTAIFGCRAGKMARFTLKGWHRRHGMTWHFCYVSKVHRID